MEARRGGWLHLLHCFHRPLFVSASLTIASSTVAYCATLPTPKLLYIARLSMLLSSEDVCKRKLVERFYTQPERGGVSATNLTSKAWNVKQGC